MKTSFPRRLSLSLNLVLALVVVAVSLHRPPAGESAAPDADSVPAEPPATPPGPTLATPHDFPATTAAADQRRWLVDRLRERGLSTELLARFVLADIEAAWTKHAAEVSMKCHGDPDTMAALQLEIDRTRDADMRAALGEADFLRWDHDNFGRQTATAGLRLTSAEVEGAYGFWKQMQSREFELRDARLKARLDDAGIGLEYERTLAQFDRQLRGLLGEQRYAQAQQSKEGAAIADLRRDFSRANPDRAQLEDLMRTQAQWNAVREELDSEYANDTSASAYAEQLRMLDEARDNEYRRVLGDAAFEAHQKEQHPGYSMMKKNAGLWGLDDQKIDSVYGSIRYYEKAVQDYQDRIRELEARGQAVARDEVHRNLEQFTAQTRQSLQTYLGKESFEKMRTNGFFDFDRNRLPTGAPIKPEDRRGG